MDERTLMRQTRSLAHPLRIGGEERGTMVLHYSYPRVGVSNLIVAQEGDSGEGRGSSGDGVAPQPTNGRNMATNWLRLPENPS